MKSFKRFIFIILLTKYLINNAIEYSNEENVLRVKNFNEFQEVNSSEINFKCNSIYFIPNKFVKFDKKIQINSAYNKYNQEIFYFFLKGIDLITSDIFLGNLVANRLSINILKSDFNIFLNDSWVKDQVFCENLLNITFDELSNSKFNNLNFEDNFFTEKICQSIFKNSQLKSISFNSMKNSMLKKNFVQFFDFEILNLNCKIESLVLSNIYRLRMNKLILDKNVFKFIKSVNIDGLLSSIDDEKLFINFIYLKEIIINAINLAEFLNFGLSWTSWININQNNENSLTSIELQNNDNDLAYDFPEVDFCLFKDLFNNNKIELKLEYVSHVKSLENVSCTLLVLISKYKKTYLKYYQFFETCCKKNLTIFKQKYLAKCDIENRLKSCNSLKSHDNKKKDDLFHIDVYEIVESLKFYFVLILKPLISLIGILLNLIIIFLMKSAFDKKEFQIEIYKFLYINAIFNIFILLISLSHMIYFCTEYNFVKCYSIKFSYFVQYLFIIFNFLESYFTFCSNFTMIIFSIKRLLLLNTETSKFGKNFLKISDRCLILILLIIGLLLNSLKLLEYQVNSDRTQEDFPIKVINKPYLSSNQIDIFKFIFLLIISLDFLFTFLFYFANLYIDIKLFNFFKKILQRKTILNIISYLTDKGENFEQKKTNMVKMIFFYGVTNFIIRTPEFVLSSIIFIHYLPKKQIFLGKRDVMYGENSVTDQLLEVTMVINKLNYLNNFFILYFFNKIFRRKFDKLCFICVQ